ncbi:MAG: hypothetical protein HYY06_28145 [Deltaproteobacteria bacterium]|nr:hypothetical protein [Deltaproteobacteria bacterium]
MYYRPGSGSGILRLVVVRILVVLGGLAAVSCAAIFPLEHRDDDDDAGAEGEGEGEPCDGSCLPDQRCVEESCVGDDPCAGVECDGDEVCSDGDCVSPLLDRDGDGSPVTSDCDDGDPEIKDGSIVPCSSDCAEGTTTCAGGEWQACTAPETCDCEPGTTREEPCGRCGTAARTCSDAGTWEVGLGPCLNEGECTPNATGVRPCGSCGTESRPCGADCTWGDYGKCVDAAECAREDTGTESCGACGTRQRTCTDQCLWTGWGTCAGEGACTPGTTRQTDCGECGAQEQTCTASCAWQNEGSCDNTPGRQAVCVDADVCTTDTCLADGTCTNPECDPSLRCCPGEGCLECCGNDPFTCRGSLGTCLEWECQEGQCVAVLAGDYTTGGCSDGSFCCEGMCVAQCCRPEEIALCGVELLCANWDCIAGVCTPMYEEAGTDPELECKGEQVCNGFGGCVSGI